MVPAWTPFLPLLRRTEPVARHRFIVGMEPDLACLEQLAGVVILDRFGNGATWALVETPADQTERVRRCFRGICHVYATEREARRAWGLFGR